MNRYLLGIALTVLLAQSGQAQQFLTDLNGQVLRENKYVDTQGSPYYAPEFQNGLITSVKGKTYANLRVRYDVYAGELEYLQNNQPYRLKAGDIQSFGLVQNGDTLRFRSGMAPTSGNEAAPAFVQVLYDGQTKLYKQPKVVLQETKPYNSPTTIREFRRQDELFVQKPDGTLHKIQRTRKSLLSTFPAQRDKLDKIIRDKGLDLNDEYALAALLSEAQM